MSKLHTDGAQEQCNDKLKNYLGAQGTTKSTEAPHSSSSNAFVKRRMLIVLAEARDALKAAPGPLKKNRFWSFAALDAIGNTNHLPIKRNRTFTPSPHTAMILHESKVDDKEGPNNFLPFGQQGCVHG